VLLMYLWAALFSGAVVGLSVIRVPLIWLALATVGAMIALLLATMPKLRPWRSTGKRAAGTRSRHRIGATPVRSIEPMSVTNGQSAALRGPAPNAMPAVLPAPLAAPTAAPAAPTAPPAAPSDGQAGQPVQPAPAPPSAAWPTARPTARPAPGTGPLSSRHARNAGATRP
jgi:hypothetical protein